MKSVVTNILILILLCMTVLRIGITYTNPTGHLYMPEWSFAYSTLGRDFDAYTMHPVYEIRQSKIPYIFGYGSVFIAALTTGLAEAVGLCNATKPQACSIFLYRFMIIAGILGYLFLLFAAIRNKNDRMIAIILFITFILGVPMNKAIEAGNIDFVIAPWIGILLLYLRRIFKKAESHTIQYVALGGICGILLNSKAFILPFVICMFIGTGANYISIATFVASFVVSALWPWIYGVRAGLWDVFAFSLRGSTEMNASLQTQVNYGNNALLPYVSNVIQTLSRGHLSYGIQNLLMWVVSIVVLYILFVKPWTDEHIMSQSKLYFSSFSFILVLFTVSYSIILTLLAWSYDYRICYGIPILFFLIAAARDTRSRQLLYIAIISLLIKSLWIPKDRIMTVFLYIHLYFTTRTALSSWKQSQSLGLKDRQTHKRFV